ncbi:acyl-CoA Delta-9 desaturase-like [Helicoverpa zea]|uniref:acyl-CoA Delta-9 desaturase-like n=1 Tax=Helicoverpa zea TaxID=7113 RepID=UPI001F582BF8|nr:acyl-CoA Delta-9 desaturase-like [Helicoverpa zea]
MIIKTAIKNFEKSLGFKNEIIWFNVMFMSAYHIFGLYWCWHYAFPVKILTVLYAFSLYILNGAGITCGVHRLFTHRSYKAVPALKIFLVMCFCGAGQNTIYQWVRDHRLHHKFSDTDADPHNANRGFFFSHIGWLMMKKNEEVKKQGKKIDMSDIEADEIVMFQEKYSKSLRLFFCYILPISLNMLLFNEEWKCAVAWQAFIRYLCVLHAEMTVNSLAHIYGYQPYNKNIIPKENKFVSAVTFGEGWHNYHHSFPFDFKASEFFDRFDWSTYLIRWWARQGWAYNLKEATPEMVSAMIKRAGEYHIVN